jgi:D-3-phosphoglycerate dehydrogenase
MIKQNFSKMRRTMRALLTDYAWADLDIERQILSTGGIELVAAPHGDEATLMQLATSCDAILTNWAKVTRGVLDAGQQLRIVARMGIGLDNIDVAYCHAKGILVTNVPDYCLIEVAEHTLALMFALARNVSWHHLATKQGRYDLKSGVAMRRIEGQTLGLVGMGQIARVVAQKARGLGMRVIGTSRSARPVEGIQVVDLQTLLAESDFVSLHVPLTSESRGMIGQQELALMKPTAFLINTARGGLIDHDALTLALQENRLAGAGLDVQPLEPPALNVAPFNDPRVIVTPHIAFLSAESLADLRRRAATQVATFLTGGTPENVIRRVR